MEPDREDGLALHGSRGRRIIRAAGYTLPPGDTSVPGGNGTHVGGTHPHAPHDIPPRLPSTSQGYRVVPEESEDFADAIEASAYIRKFCRGEVKASLAELVNLRDHSDRDSVRKDAACTLLAFATEDDPPEVSHGRQPVHQLGLTEDEMRQVLIARRKAMGRQREP